MAWSYQVVTQVQRLATVWDVQLSCSNPDYEGYSMITEGEFDHDPSGADLDGLLAARTAPIDSEWALYQADLTQDKPPFAQWLQRPTLELPGGAGVETPDLCYVLWDGAGSIQGVYRDQEVALGNVSDGQVVTPVVYTP